LGRHRLIMVVTDLGANILGRVEVPFPAYQGPDVCLPLLADAVRDFIDQQGISWNKVIDVGIGVICS